MTTIPPDNSDISVTHQNGINLLRFDRVEKKNAITGAMYAALEAAITNGENNDDIRVHALLGHPGVFTAGNDIKDFMATTTAGSGLGTEVLDFLKTLVTASKPLVAGVDGLAIGIGATMLLHFDLVYATARSYFQTPFTNLGLVPEAASSLLAPRLLGHQRAFALLAFGERWPAQTAFESGLVNQIIEPENIESYTLEAAGTLASKPPQSISTTRRLLRGSPDDILARIDQEAEHFKQHLNSVEAQQAFTAFMNR